MTELIASQERGRVRRALKEVDYVLSERRTGNTITGIQEQIEKYGYDTDPSLLEMTIRDLEEHKAKLNVELEEWKTK